MARDREVRQQELARLLFQKARQDLALVSNVGDSEAEADEIIGFHVQPAIEKAIKAVLTRLGIQYELSLKDSTNRRRQRVFGLVVYP